jgi:hypothetical protein
LIVYQLGEGLKDNHTILGIHMLGNEGVTDTQGFVNPNDDNGMSQEAMSHIFSRIKRKP